MTEITAIADRLRQAAAFVQAFAENRFRKVTAHTAWECGFDAEGDEAEIYEDPETGSTAILSLDRTEITMVDDDAHAYTIELTTGQIQQR